MSQDIVIKIDILNIYHNLAQISTVRPVKAVGGSLRYEVSFRVGSVLVPTTQCCLVLYS